MMHEGKLIAGTFKVISGIDHMAQLADRNFILQIDRAGKQSGKRTEQNDSHRNQKRADSQSDQ